MWNDCVACASRQQVDRKVCPRFSVTLVQQQQRIIISTKAHTSKSMLKTEALSFCPLRIAFMPFLFPVASLKQWQVGAFQSLSHSQSLSLTLSLSLPLSLLFLSLFCLLWFISSFNPYRRVLRNCRCSHFTITVKKTEVPNILYLL